MLRLRGLTAMGALLRRNLWATQRCSRLRLSLADWQAPVPRPVNGSLVVTRGRLEELVDWRRGRPRATLEMDFFMDEIRGLEWFYLGRWNGDIAHISWVATHGKPSSIPDLQLKPDEAEIRAALTLDGFRRKGIFGSVLPLVLKDLQSAGMRTVYAHVNEGNTASLSRFLAAGFHPASRVTFRRVFFLNWIKDEKVAPLVRNP